METKNLKNIVKAVSKLKLDKCVIAEPGVMIKGGYLYANNLEVGMRIKIDWDGADLFIDSSMWKKLTGNFKSFTTTAVDEKSTKLIADGAKITIPTYNLDEYPSGPQKLTTEHKLVLEATKKDMQGLVRALDYIGKDELRQSMMQVAINNGHIVATDAHKLLFLKTETAAYSNILVRPDAIRIANDLGWNDALIYEDGSHLFMFNGEDLIWWRLVDEKYPQWENVLPKEHTTEVSFSKKPMLEGIKQAMLFANSTTKQVAFHLNGSATISSADIDFNQEYSKELDCNYAKNGTDIEIGFNGSYLSDVFNDVERDNIVMKMSTPSRPVIINDEVLLTPVMLTK